MEFFYRFHILQNAFPNLTAELQENDDDTVARQVNGIADLEEPTLDYGENFSDISHEPLRNDVQAGALNLREDNEWYNYR